MITARSVVSAEEFYRALKKAFPACAKESWVPELNNAKVSFQGDSCRIVCTNLEQWCEVTIPAEGGEFSFGFKDTKRILTVCKHYSGSLEFAYMQDQPPAYAPTKTDLSGTLSLRCGARSSEWRVGPADSNMDLPQVEKPRVYQANADSLYQRYRRIRYARSNSTARPTFRCVEFIDSRMVTLDGYRLAMSQDESFTVKRHFFVPPEAMDLLPVFEGADCTLLDGGDRVAFESDSIRIVSRTTWDAGMDLEKTVPKDSAENCDVDVDKFLAELQYLSDFIAPGKPDPIRYHSGRLSLCNAGHSCSTSLGLNDPPMTVCGFNHRYMMEALKQFRAKKVKTVTLGLTSRLSPIVLTDGSGDLAMVLPVRLKEEYAA